MHDLVIRGGTIVDGTGAPAQTGDVAVQGGVITGVGRDLGAAKRTIDADGLLVTPGWVDIHTHYDAQATWDPQLLPSGWHGVTTAVVGNCGVGFAPARPDQRQMMIELMEGVEDIPGAALSEGIKWDWETFPQYLDAAAARNPALNLAFLAPLTRTCAVCGSTGSAHLPNWLSSCGRCLKVCYCSAACQRAHWAEHALVCEPAGEEAVAAAATADEVKEPYWRVTRQIGPD